MSDFGSGLEQCGPMHELSGRASKADLRRRIAVLEAERDALLLAAYYEAGGFDSPKGFTNWVAVLRTTLRK